MKNRLIGLMILMSISLSASEFTQAKKDCNNNIAKACHRLGYIYAIEKGNEQRGIEAYLKGASLGYVRSYLALGYLYEEKGDIATEKKYLKKGCDSGSDLGCGILGMKYFEENNYQKAQPLLKKACYSNDADIDEKSKQELCRDLDDISNTVIVQSMDNYRNCLMTYKTSPDVGAICLKDVPKSIPSLLSEKNQKAMKKCIASTRMNIAVEPKLFCAEKLGLKYIRK